MNPALAFELPERLYADRPPEERGLDRDQVRLLVATRADGSLVHARFRELPDFLAPGDLLVVNVSATVPAAVLGKRADGGAVRIHFSTRAPALPESWFVAEVRSADGSKPLFGALAGERIELPGGASVELVAPYASGVRLMLVRLRADRPLLDYLGDHGEPIRYDYVAERWPLQAYQTIFARTPGSAEMPSAGRPFTPELIVQLVGAGVAIAPVTLHAGVSSPEHHEAPFPEQYEVPESTVRQIASTKGWGGRVIAVGTTVVRALESAARGDGTVAPASGWTNLVITRERGVLTVDGMITGWHEPAASHLQMLAAVAGEPLLASSYRAALHHGYLWHEFGDSHLILR